MSEKTPAQIAGDLREAANKTLAMIEDDFQRAARA